MIAKLAAIVAFTLSLLGFQFGGTTWSNRITDDHGDALYRRSMYTFWKRTAPPPSLEILNAPGRDVFCTRRERTDTPLQALVTMNDPQLIEAARLLATHACQSSTTFEARLNGITERLLGRRLAPAEQKVVRSMHDRAAASYEKDPAAAAALLGVGENKPTDAAKPAELAAWTLVASEIMNLDEALTK